MVQLLTTGLLLLTAMSALIYGLDHGIWLALILAAPAALFLVRLFIIQHDCGHGSIQHQFENAYWEAEPRWVFRAAALQGSSFYDPPRVLHWLTGSIGFHHIHHLASKIPNYRLQTCFAETPAFQQVERLTIWGSFKCLQVDRRAAILSSGDHRRRARRTQTPSALSMAALIPACGMLGLALRRFRVPAALAG